MISVKNFAWLVMIFVCAAAFRLTNLDLIEFKLDEARDVYEMERFYQSPYFIQRGTIQSTGVYNPPLWYYILAVISLPSRDPQYLSFMIALTNCVAVVGFYWAVKRFYGQFAGAVAGFLMAFSPWMIVFSRKIWAPDMIFPLVVPLVFFLHRLILEKRSQDILWVIVLSLLLGQLHASGWFLLFSLILSLAIFRVKISLKHALIGFLIGIIPLLPYFSFQLTNACPDCQAFFTYQEGGALSTTPIFDPNVFLRPFQFINGSSWNGVLGGAGYREFIEQYPIIRVFNILFLLEFGLFAVGAVFVKRWLLGVIITVVLLLFISRTPAHLYYFLIVSPILILIYAVGISWFRRFISIMIIIVVIIINIMFQASFDRFLGGQGVIAGDFGATYGVIKELAEEKLVQFKDRPDYNLIRAEYWIQLFNSSSP